MEQKEGEPAPNAAQSPYVGDDKQRLLALSEISLWLDCYDDIFSDFDPRPYSDRELSDDFLAAAKKATRDKPLGIIELKFLIPSAKRDTNQENLIKRRVREHFKKQYGWFNDEVTAIIKKGALFTILGVILMFTATAIIYKGQEDNLFISFLIVLLEPAGWFMFWEGLGHIFFESKKKKSDLDFYKKMSKCKVEFLSY
ncbi:hypothetical protein HY643_04415 [Candidatus Woesearchaeota archaeon]|nr:hypothetical protein [Candidatus Woesearchaeota archaeon]